MINSQFSLSARDKLLRIPVHWAAIGGHDGCVDLLLKAGSDQFQKDCLGRTPFHYAATGGKATLLIIMASKDPEIVHWTDDHGRTALHYAIFNNNQKQVNIIRTLLELKSDINAVDEDRKTPLHHASENAKTRIIPILIQNGASLVIKDNVNKKTPLQCAANDKIRELIMLYSDPEYDPSKEAAAKLELLKPTKQYDQETLKKSRGDIFEDFGTGVSGNKTDFINLPESKKKSAKKSKKSGYEEQKGYYDELEELEKKGILPFNLRNHRTKLIKLLRKVQEYGINHDLHKKKKFLFSGSWMEKVDDLTDLMANIVESNSSEIALKLFNVLHPYDKPLPNIDEEEDVLKEFYDGSTKPKFDPVGDLKKTTPQALKERLAAQGITNLMSEKDRKDLLKEFRESQEENYYNDQMVSSQELEDLKAVLKSTEQKLEDALQEWGKLKLTIDEREEVIEELREQLEQAELKSNKNDSNLFWIYYSVVISFSLSQFKLLLRRWSKSWR